MFRENLMGYENLEPKAGDFFNAEVEISKHKYGGSEAVREQRDSGVVNNYTLSSYLLSKLS